MLNAFRCAPRAAQEMSRTAHVTVARRVCDLDYKTTYNYLQNIQHLGQVYVNDAPLASLTTSNSVAEVKFRHNVMGVKMTEEIRKLAQFFMKPFPLDVK